MSEKRSGNLREQDLLLFILQYLKDNKYKESFETLQRESEFSFNFFSEIKEFTKNIEDGNWDLVTSSKSNIELLHQNSRLMIYEQMFYELIELGETTLANHLFNEVIRKQLELSDNEKLRQLSKVDHREVTNLFRTKSKFDRRRYIVKSILSELKKNEFPPNRILQLISKGLKYESHIQSLQPTNSNIKEEEGEEEEEEEIDSSSPSFFPQKKAKSKIKIENSYSQCICISSNGKYLISGSHDGFIEIFDPISGSMDKNLPYQSANRFMKHSRGITAFTVSQNSKYLGSGDVKGTLKIWELEIGRCLAKFDNIHSNNKGITSLSMTSDNSKIASAGLDFQIIIIGLRTGKILHTISKPHRSTIKTLSFCGNNDKFLISSGADGVVNIFSGKTFKKAKNPIKPKTFEEFSPCVIFDLVIDKDLKIYVCNSSSNSIGVYDLTKKIEEDESSIPLVVSLENPYFSKTGCFTKMLVRDGMLYSLTETGVLFLFDCSISKLVRSGQFVKKKKIVLDFVIHPLKNILYTSDEKWIKIWK